MIIKPKIQMVDVGCQELRTAVWPGKKGARPILFFNGIGANLELAAPLADDLNGRSDFIAFDAPGIGGSPEPTWPYRPWWLARAAKKILDTLGYDEVDVIGVSWGGGMAQQFAIQYSRRVKNLILAATSTGVTMVPGDMSALSKMAAPSRYTNPEYLKKHYQTLYGPSEQESIHEHAAKIIPPTLKGYNFQLLAMLGWTSVPFLPFLSQRTLILAGDEDKIVPVINAKMLKGLIRKSELKIIEGAGHLFIVSHPDDVIPAITRFCDGESVVDMPDLTVSAAHA